MTLDSVVDAWFDTSLHHWLNKKKLKSMLRAEVEKFWTSNFIKYGGSKERYSDIKRLLGGADKK